MSSTQSTHDCSPTRHGCPPATPPLYRKYLRAAYDYNPDSSDSGAASGTNSVTVPLRKGDVILVHLTHSNGWADGTILTNGARGWLPTNFCEAYDHSYLRNLLHALTQLWDSLRPGEANHSWADGRQDHVQGLIAGVRCFLVCLNQQSPVSATNLTSQRNAATAFTAMMQSFRPT